MTARVTLNPEMGLFVLHYPKGVSCLGFDVAIDWTTRIAQELVRGDLMPVAERGTLSSYLEYEFAVEVVKESGRRLECFLSPQLKGLEGKRVEVVTIYGDRETFTVGKSTGFMPIHLEMDGKDRYGSAAASWYENVTVLS